MIKVHYTCINYISATCVCVGGGGGGLVFGSKCTEFLGEVKVHQIKRSWCDRVKVFVTVLLHMQHCALIGVSLSKPIAT